MKPEDTCKTPLTEEQIADNLEKVEEEEIEMEDYMEDYGVHIRQ